MNELPFRQIHLDFHTSPLIPDVGVEFDPEEFAATLKKARVQSINIFAKCHHGYSYYPSKVGPTHPSLKFDLMGKMIDVLHRNGIKCPLYTTVVYDEYAAESHPEWLQLDSHGTIVGREPYGDNEGRERWLYLCVNTPYLDYLSAQVVEILDGYDVDGLWFDILKYSTDGCSCSSCRRSMAEAGLDPSKLEDRQTWTYTALRTAMKRLHDLVVSKKPDSLVFFNGRQRIDDHPLRSLRKELEYVTHLELESLPSGEWGYYHFPLLVRYNQILGKQIIGMNGRFHRSWADFGGYKNKAALEYECNSMLASGAKVCVGDQLHPRGRLEPVTYDLIGSVFEEIAKKEPWCTGAYPLADIGLYAATDGEYGSYLRPRIKALEGAMQMLVEDHRQFQVIDSETDFRRYKLIVFPDRARFDEALANKVGAYLKAGGRILLTYQSGLAEDKDEFALDFGFTISGFSEFRTAYLRFGDQLKEGLTAADYVVYDRCTNLVPGRGQTLADRIDPYFDRSWDHFMSHAQTPPDKKSDFAGIVRAGNVVYCAFPLFRTYKQFGNFVFKKAVVNCIDLLLGERTIASDLPSTAQVTMLEQKKNRRRVIHVLHYPRERRAAIDIIEDLIPLFGVHMKVRTQAQPKMVYLAPTKQDLDFTYRDGVVAFTIPEIKGHQMIIVDE
jgi:hypothetical protein